MKACRGMVGVLQMFNVCSGRTVAEPQLVEVLDARLPWWTIRLGPGVILDRYRGRRRFLRCTVEVIAGRYVGPIVLPAHDVISLQSSAVLADKLLWSLGPNRGACVHNNFAELAISHVEACEIHEQV